MFIAINVSYILLLLLLLLLLNNYIFDLTNE